MSEIMNIESVTEKNLITSEALDSIKNEGFYLDKPGLNLYESTPFQLHGYPCKLQYSFQRNPKNGVYASTQSRFTTTDGEIIATDTINFGETVTNEIVAGGSIETNENFRRKGFGSDLFNIRDEIIQTTIDNYSGFQGRSINVTIFDAADIPGWSSDKAKQNKYHQLGENIWTKKFIPNPITHRNKRFKPIRLIAA